METFEHNSKEPPVWGLYVTVKTSCLTHMDGLRVIKRMDSPNGYIYAVQRITNSFH